jgi:hypothetical protein
VTGSPGPVSPDEADKEFADAADWLSRIRGGA